MTFVRLRKTLALSIVRSYLEYQQNAAIKKMVDPQFIHVQKIVS